MYIDGVNSTQRSDWSFSFDNLYSKYSFCEKFGRWEFFNIDVENAVLSGHDASLAGAAGIGIFVI
jgi:hypothetical protein